jgi:hypothetical protein
MYVEECWSSSLQVSATDIVLSAIAFSKFIPLLSAMQNIGYVTQLGRIDRRVNTMVSLIGSVLSKSWVIYSIGEYRN